MTNADARQRSVGPLNDGQRNVINTEPSEPVLGRDGTGPDTTRNDHDDSGQT